MTRKKILLTGGAGFIGHHLVQALRPDNELYVVDNLYRQHAAPAWLAAQPDVRFLHRDVRDLEAVSRFLPPDLTHIVHLAAVAGVLTVCQDPVESTRSNLEGSLAALSLAERFPYLERFVFFSSSEVYGPNATDVAERDLDLRLRIEEPRWTYAASKLASEMIFYQFGRQSGLPVTIVRPFNVYGPHQLGESAVHTFAAQALGGRPLCIRGTGRQRRAWCYVDDLVQGVLLLLGSRRAEGEVFNLGNPEAVCTVRELALAIRAAAGSSSPLQEETLTFEDVEDRVPSIRKAESVLGFEPRVGLRDGLERTVRWYERLRDEASRVQPAE
jgi:nucleoside-diphosphate-sugar epimerase